MSGKTSKKLKFKEQMFHSIGVTAAYVCTLQPIVNDRCKCQMEILPDTNVITKLSQIHNITLFNSNMFKMIFFVLAYSYI